ncbi:MAG: hypothetical protein KAW92_01000 [Candidatus Cloacimonetes bacterium]|nr:hypothetical protein [Candidatus Cloacimonadota bacterium]MEA3475532.1 hypothetical protein [Candidatus Cloacimonadota bacterium]
MEISEAKADVFWLAFRSLPKKERHIFIEKLFVDKEFREDLIDTMILVQRHDEPSRPLEDYLAERK